MSSSWKALGVLCLLVIGIYAYTAPLGRLESLSSNPSDTYYNLLVQGFDDGHLSLKKEVPPGFARLTDPYDPDANRIYRGMPYGLSDLSYYKGRFYLYFGVTPVLILFWPFAALTGHYLSNRLAVAIFCAVGVAINLGLLRALWRRYFPKVNVGVVAACGLALGLATGLPMLLPPSDIYQVAISCGYMLTMVALGAVWCALHDTEHRCGWLLAASVAYGLAVGARPSLLLGAVILLVPVVYAWRERQPMATGLMAATVPITLIGLGLMLYNFRRFDNPFEFGLHSQLGGARQVSMQYFNLRYLWFNFRVNFLEPVRWKTHFPFVRDAIIPPFPPGYTGVQGAFGVLTNTPLVWLALAVPLAWRERSAQEQGALRWFVTAVWLLFGMCALTLGFYCTAAGRYEVEFLSALMLLAVVGILGLERALTDQPARRRLIRWGWGALLGFSVAFNVLVSVKNYAVAGSSAATILSGEGRLPEAIQVFKKSLQMDPDYAEGHHNLGFVLWKAGQRQEALREDEYALRLKPDYADAHVSLGMAFARLGRPEDAVQHWEDALRINPNYAEAYYDIGVVLQQKGRLQEAVEHYEQTLRFQPDYIEAHNNLGLALAGLGRIQDAIEHYEKALRIKPNYAGAHYNLGMALQQTGRLQEAVEHYEQALELKPDYVEAHYNLGVALAQLGRIQEAMGHWEQALQNRPDYVEAHYSLGLALEKMGRVPEAIEHYRQALAIRPDFTAAKNALQRLGTNP
jgi:tetratricopeptide (TPR) repeat protein